MGDPGGVERPDDEFVFAVVPSLEVTVGVEQHVAFGRGREMAVLERWRQVADDPGWRDALDRETVELSNRIFGDVTNGAVTCPGG